MLRAFKVLVLLSAMSLYAQGPVKEGGVRVKGGGVASQALPICPRATLADGGVTAYANLVCQQTGVNGTLTYTFPDLATLYKSTGSVIIPPDQVTIILDPQGPYTLLWGSAKWNLTAGQTTTMVVTFHVSSTNNPGSVNPWAHVCAATGTGKVTTQQVVLGNPNIVADASCVAGGNPEPQDPTPHPGSDIDTQVIVSLDAGNGTASLKSLGSHFK